MNAEDARRTLRTRPRQVRLPVKIEEDDRKLFSQKRWEPYISNIAELERDGLVTNDMVLFIYGMFIEWDASQEYTYSQFRRAVARFLAQYNEVSPRGAPS